MFEVLQTRLVKQFIGLVMDYRVRRSWIENARAAVFLMYGILALPLMHSGLRAAPEANFNLTHPFWT